MRSATWPCQFHLRRFLTALAVAALASCPCAPKAIAGSISGCDYYAAPAGAGNGLSPAAPFRIADFWAVASPGKTLCLLNGVYDDAQGMIDPPAGLSGLSGSPITIKALNDGGVLITGHAIRHPVLLLGNDWFVVEGLNACCSSSTVVGLGRSSHNIIRRVAAWDAADGNDSIFGIHYHGDHNLLEDVAGWGIARKIYDSSQGGDFTTIRRAWGRWEGSHVIGPKMAYTLAYNNYDMLVENAIGTWSGERMKKSYVLLDYDGKPWLGKDGGTYTNYRVNQPYGIFAVDRLDGDKNARARLLGSIAYVGKTDTFKAPSEVLVTDIDSVEIKDTVAAYAPGGTYSGKHTFGLYGLTTNTANGGETNVRALDLTSFSADSLGDQIGKGWQQANILRGQSTTVYTEGSSVYVADQGANLCHQYIDGNLTDRPLWPWPMNRRIKEAMIQSGRAPLDVTATITQLFGPIPADCGGDSRRVEPDVPTRPRRHGWFIARPRGAANKTEETQAFKILLWDRVGAVFSVTPAQHLAPGSRAQWSVKTLFPDAEGKILVTEFRSEDRSAALAAYGGHFLSDVSLANPSNPLAADTLKFLERDKDKTSTRSATFTLFPDLIRQTDDPLPTLVGLSETYGPLKIQTSAASGLLVSERIYTPSPRTSGTVGQQVDPVTPEALFSNGSLLDLRQDAAFRTNVAFFNPNPSWAAVNLTLSAPSGESLGTTSVLIPAFGYLQRSLTQLFGLDSFPPESPLTLYIDAGGDKIFAFGTTID